MSALHRRSLLAGAAAVAVAPIAPAALAAVPADTLLAQWREARAVAGVAADRTAAEHLAFREREGTLTLRRRLDRASPAEQEALTEELFVRLHEATKALHDEEDRLFEIVDALERRIHARPLLSLGDVAARLELALDHMSPPGDCYGAQLVTDLIADLRRSV